LEHGDPSRRVHGGCNQEFQVEGNCDYMAIVATIPERYRREGRDDAYWEPQ
jgi:hypothetical protein